MDIKSRFVLLTKKTYPHGTEELLEYFLPRGFKMDGHGNYFITIGNSRTMFTCHLDTASANFEDVNHRFSGDFIMSDGTTILGADDKAGMIILLHMIENNIPGTYYFFVGEEVGCIGSGRLSGTYEGGLYDRCVSFDRRGYGSIITHQFWSRCCSDNFANALKLEMNLTGLNFNLDDTGITTDSASFMEQIPECTNISVGYFNEHTIREKQNISFLEKLCKSLCLINWELLPTERKPGLSFLEMDMDPDLDVDDNNTSKKLQVFVEDESYIVILKPDRILKERSLIYDWVISTGSYYDVSGMDWDGVDCYLHYQNIKEHIGNRTDLIHVINDLSVIPIEEFTILEKVY